MRFLRACAILAAAVLAAAAAAGAATAPDPLAQLGKPAGYRSFVNTKTGVAFACEGWIVRNRQGRTVGYIERCFVAGHSKPKPKPKNGFGA